MGNHLRKSVSRTDVKYLLQHTQFTKKHILDFYQDFMKFNPDGFMDFSDFKDFLYGFYEDNTYEIALHYFRAADKDNNGKINFKEFLLFLNHESTSKPEERLEWMFDLFDVDGNGTIELPEMIKIYQNALSFSEASDVPNPEEVAKMMFDRCDRNHDEKLTKEEFVSTMLEDPVLFSIFCRITEDDK